MTYNPARQIKNESQRIDDNDRNPRDGGGKDAHQANENLHQAPRSYECAVLKESQQIGVAAVALVALHVVAIVLDEVGAFDRGAEHDAGADEQPDARDEEADLNTLHCGGEAVVGVQVEEVLVQAEEEEEEVVVVVMMVDERRTKPSLQATGNERIHTPP